MPFVYGSLFPERDDNQNTVKSTQYKGYGIGHKKNYNKLLKKCVNARKKPKFYDAYAKFQNKTSKNISISFFGIYHTFSIIC